jgi:acetyl-CoA carboxylase beta subunit
MDIEFLPERGMLDPVVPRQRLKEHIDRALSFMTAAA